jgi:hypothetical protein
MKTGYIVVCLVLTLVSSGFAEISGIPWGITEEQVKKVETGKCDKGVYHGLRYLKYNKRFEGFESSKTYWFDQEGRLYRMIYEIAPRGFYRLGTYRKLRKIMTAKYGGPNLEIVTEDTSRIEWEREDTTVRLSAHFSDPRFHVIYFSTPMYGSVSRSMLLLLCDELEEKRLEKSKSKGLELMSLSAE